MPTTNAFLDRPPRIQPSIPIGEIEIPPPPDKGSQYQPTLWEMLLPLLTLGGYLFLAMSGRGRSPYIIIPMGLAMFASIFMSLRRANFAQKDIKAKTEAYAQRLVDLRHEMNNDHQKQRDFFLFNYPSVQTVLDITFQPLEHVSRSGPRIWERRTIDADFGTIRLGVGTRISTIYYKVSQGTNEEDPQMDEALRLCDDSRYVTNVPITLQLYAHPDIEGETRNALGVYHRYSPHYTPTTPSNEILYQYVHAMLVHFTTFHAPNDARLFVLSTRTGRAEWEWTRQLPHCQSGEEISVCFDDESVKIHDEYTPRIPIFWKNLRKELQARQQQAGEKDSGETRLPFLLVVVDLLNVEAESDLANVEAEPTISLIINQGRELGAAVIFLTETGAKIPSDCQAVIELETLGASNVIFRYAETGINTPRFVGEADLIPTTIQTTYQMQAAGFAEALAQYKIRIGAAFSLANSVNFLNLNNAETMDGLHMLESWQRSREGGEWPRVSIGLKSGNEPYEVIFSADASGVHGMIAGTTGSGKSELLLTLIMGLAIRYDPSAVNFVLVDFKGGAAFDELRELPHCVDIVTNLDDSAVERMFSSIKAELDRRSELIASSRTKHIVDYRNKGYHRPDNPSYRGPFPHLFIIIDEFAEMVSEKPEFKAQLDSITRLGRAIGVSLILATQRPSGVITDQMRANMSLKICLRVETPDDSRELLRRSDAAFLPTSIPGRALVQVGNEPPEMIQVARVSLTYEPTALVEIENLPDIIWLRSDSDTTDEQKQVQLLSTALVQEMCAYTEDEANRIVKQLKPWPSPLPRYLTLDMPLETTYWSREDHPLTAYPNTTGPTRLSRAVYGWRNGVSHWVSNIWKTDHALRANIGLIDHPRGARQHVLSLDLMEGHIVILGASGWGKTTFLRSLIIALAATHSPADLHIYLLDFGGRNLAVFKPPDRFGKSQIGLPHVGALITPEEEDRFTRLLRSLNHELDRRKRSLAQFNADNIVDYNQKVQPSQRFASLLVIVDNFAEIKENFENFLPILASLLREGRNAGIHFVATADVPNSLTGKLYNLFTTRLTLQLADSSEYSNIVGRGAPLFGEILGRGLVRVSRDVSRTPLEVQIAAPLALTEELGDRQEMLEGIDKESQRDIEEKLVDRLSKVIGDLMRQFVETQHRVHESQPYDKDQLPMSIKRLPDYIHYDTLAGQPLIDDPHTIFMRVGIEDNELKVQTLDLHNYPHFIVIGPPLSGKSTFLRTAALSLALTYTPDEVTIILIDPHDRLIHFNGIHLDQLPHVYAISQQDDFELVVQQLQQEYENRGQGKHPEVYVFIDNYDDLREIMADRSEALKILGSLARNHHQNGLHFILCGSPEIMRNNDELRRGVWQSRYGFALKSDKIVEALGGKAPRSLRDAELPSGRGFLVFAGRSTLVQLATFDLQDNSINSEMAAETTTVLDQQIAEVCQRYPTPYEWQYLGHEAEPVEAPTTSIPEPTPEQPEPSQPLATSQPQNPVFEPPQPKRGKNQTHPYYSILTAYALQHMPIEFVTQVLDFNDICSTDNFYTLTLEQLQTHLDADDMMFKSINPDDRDFARRQLRQRFLELVPPNIIHQLPFELLKSLELRLDRGLNLETLQENTEEELVQLFEDRRIMPPNKLNQAVIEAVQDFMKGKAQKQ